MSFILVGKKIWVILFIYGMIVLVDNFLKSEFEKNSLELRRNYSKVVLIVYY